MSETTPVPVINCHQKVDIDFPVGGPLVIPATECQDYEGSPAALEDFMTKHAIPANTHIERLGPDAAICYASTCLHCLLSSLSPEELRSQALSVIESTKPDYPSPVRGLF